MKILLTGCLGQLGHEVRARIPQGVQLLGVDLPELDILDPEAIADQMRAFQPDALVNAAAWTAVDQAEEEEARATAVNADGAANLARAAAASGARLIHISTDFVFSGPRDSPWRPEDAPCPASAYGRGKLQGERQVLDILPEALILRTSWLHSAHGANFVRTMLRLLAGADPVRVVADQTGSPTWAGSLAETVWAALATPNFHGIHHWCDAGATTWHAFAQAIATEGQGADLLETVAPIEAIATIDWPTPAARPEYSVLDTTSTATALGLQPRDWQEGLRRNIQELATA